MVYVWTIVIWGIQIALMLLSVVIGIKRKKLAQKTGRFYPWIVLGWNLVLFLGYILVFFLASSIPALFYATPRGLGGTVVGVVWYVYGLVYRFVFPAYTIIEIITYMIMRQKRS